MNSPDLVVRLIDAFENAGVPYMLTGLVASSYYDGPGCKNEAQFVLQISTDQLSAVALALGPNFKMDPQMAIDPVTMTMRYILKHEPAKFQFDLFLLGPDAHDQARFDRRRDLPFQGTTACLPTAEDVIIATLRWSKEATRENDMQTLNSVLASRLGKLDMTYLRKWTDQHGTQELLKQLLTNTTGRT
jgi:hypothetical protein